jgi:hypothetical protein
MPTISAKPLIVGGGFVINYVSTSTVAGTVELQRSADGGTTWTTLYQTVSPLKDGFGLFVDLGELQPGPSGQFLDTHLDFSTSYIYQITDNTGSAQTSAQTPYQQITLTWDQMTYYITRMLQAGIDALVLPIGIRRAEVMQVLPTGQIMESLPFVFVNQELLQMQEIPIGLTQAFNPLSSTHTMPMLTLRRFSLLVEALDSNTLNYYHDACIAVLISSLTDLFNSLNLQQNISVQFQSTQGASASEDRSPNRYWAQIQFDFKGPLDITATYQNIGTIQQITISLNGVTTVEIPVK